MVVPRRAFTDSVELVPIAPIPVAEFLVQDFEARRTASRARCLRCLSGFARSRSSAARISSSRRLAAAKLEFNRPEYDGELKGGLQLRADAPKHPDDGGTFQGSTLQMDNVQRPDGTPTEAGTLGQSVGRIFNKEFSTTLLRPTSHEVCRSNGSTSRVTALACSVIGRPRSRRLRRQVRRALTYSSAVRRSRSSRCAASSTRSVTARCERSRCSV